MNKRTILIDLDGVLNIYNGQYDEFFIPPMAPFAYEFIKKLSMDYKIVIFTSRNLLIASKWVMDNKLENFISDVTNVKIPAFLIIDDRCINFSGNFSELRDKIDNFIPWYKM